MCTFYTPQCESIEIQAEILVREPYLQFFIEVRDFPHRIFGSCTRYPRGLTRWAELLGRRRRRRRRQLVSPGGYRPPDPPPSLISKGAGLQNVRSHTRMLGPSVFPDSNTPNLTKSEQEHTFSKTGHVQKLQKCQLLEKKSRRRPSGRDSQELVRRYPVWKLTSTK